MNKKYLVNYNTGVTEESDTLDQAIEIAEKGLTYTQEDVDIYYGEERKATLKWYGVEPTDDAIVTASFGDFGFYGEWICW